MRRTWRWGLIGGGKGSQIGPVHLMAARLDGHFTLAAGALDRNPAAGRAYARSLGVADERAYGDWREMLEAEAGRDDRLDLVTVATPNATHFEIAHAFLEAGFHVLCEKPLTATVAEAETLVRLAEARGRICAVNYGYVGYPLVRQMRAMVEAGELGAIRLIKAEFAHGHHAPDSAAAAAQADNPRLRWRYDPNEAGISAVLADCGIHALHMACFVTGHDVERLAADLATCVAGRQLEDDAMVSFRTDRGAVGRLWSSAVAVGRQHGLTLQVFGEKGGLGWAQEHPEQLHWTPVGGRRQIIERGEAGLAAAAASRLALGHPEGMTLAFANIYASIAEAIRAEAEGRPPDPATPPYPSAVDGLRSIAAIEAAVASAANEGRWTDARPPMLQP